MDNGDSENEKENSGFIIDNATADLSESETETNDSGTYTETENEDGDNAAFNDDELEHLQYDDYLYHEGDTGKHFTDSNSSNNDSDQENTTAPPVPSKVLSHSTNLEASTTPAPALVCPPPPLISEYVKSPVTVPVADDDVMDAPELVSAKLSAISKMGNSLITTPSSPKKSVPPTSPKSPILLASKSASPPPMHSSNSSSTNPTSTSTSSSGSTTSDTGDSGPTMYYYELLAERFSSFLWLLFCFFFVICMYGGTNTHHYQVCYPSFWRDCIASGDCVPLEQFYFPYNFCSFVLQMGMMLVDLILILF